MNGVTERLRKLHMKNEKRNNKQIKKEPIVERKQLPLGWKAK